MGITFIFDMQKNYHEFLFDSELHKSICEQFTFIRRAISGAPSNEKGRESRRSNVDWIAGSSFGASLIKWLL